ncbi:MAG TPA: sialidase family protein, partial [Gaiellaceae bacterium]|nr:sialidase family protein [Gaiellaceae bacterium]
ALAFDADGRAYYGTLGFRFVGPVNATNPDVLVSTSGDKGKSWDVHVVAAGSGNEGSVGDLLDKEYVAAWGHGNAIVTYGDYRADSRGAFTTARIYDSVTHDGGATWSAPRLVSGSLDQSFVSVPTVAADGKIYVAFLNTTDLVTGRDDYEVVRVSPATGAALTAPVKVATVIDGFRDYPVALGRQTYQDSVFRSWAAGNIAADPTNASHLAVVWSDMRNSPPPSPDLNPYTSVTNSDVIVSESTDGGAHWSAAQAVALPGDQFQQWAAFDKNGVLRIGTFDRSYDPANHKYGFTMLKKTGGGFASTQVTDVLSDPTKNDRWFARNLNPAFPNATAFLGDYANIAATPDGGVVAYWTDMRNPANFGGVTRSGQDAYFAKTQ